MSIEVHNITKLYGAQKALDEVSFSIGTGEVVGFLGPNGAGKSTMMKVLTSFIPPTSGQATVCGHDVQREPLEVRRKVGYLPEHNPLYPEMYVKEYLSMVAGMYGMRKRARQVVEMIDRVGLGREQHKRIGTLSKGYRQRVGLAQAMIHDPEVLILDEPTSGLDPNQLVEIRELIRSVGKRRTVMLSTHIMQEVEATCDRVIIIDQGRTVADDKAQTLKNMRQQHEVLLIEFDGAIEAQALRSIEGIRHAQHLGANRWELQLEGGSDARPALFELAVSSQLKVLALQQVGRGLEEVFKQLTKKA